MEFVGVKEGVVQYLRAHIIIGELIPCQKLNEIELSSRLGISRGPLREAFRLLENEHLVASIPRKGCYVTEVSMGACRELFEAREMIECFAVDLLKERGIRDLPAVAEALEASADLPTPSDSDPYDKFEYLRAIADFHIKLIESAANSLLNHFFRTIFSSLARYQSMYVYVPGLMNTSQEEHKEILTLIKEGDYAQAKRALSLHIHKFIAFIEEKIGMHERAGDISLK
ncbi:MAG: GntR family transcriptional regulator [Desulfatiglandales bacterium]